MSEQDSNPNRWHPEQMPDETSELPSEHATDYPAVQAGMTTPDPPTPRRPRGLASGRGLLAAAAAALLLVAGTGGFTIGRVTADHHVPSFTDRGGDDRGFVGDRGGDGDDQQLAPQPQGPTRGTDISFSLAGGHA